MNDMRRYSTSGIFISVLLVLSIFTLISISEVNAAEVISVNAKGYENTIIIEFENESTSKTVSYTHLTLPTTPYV